MPIVKRHLQRLTGEATAMPVHYQDRALRSARHCRRQPDRGSIRSSCVNAARRSDGLQDLRRLAESDRLRDPCPSQVEQEGRALAQQARTEAQLTLECAPRTDPAPRSHRRSQNPRSAVGRARCRTAVDRPDDAWCCGAGGARHDSRAPARDADARCVHRYGVANAARRHAAARRRPLPSCWQRKGGLFRLVGDDPYPFRQILKELSGHYLVAFEAADPDRDGRVHRIGVKVRGPRVTVRARPAFQFTPAASSPTVDTELVSLLRNPRLATELPLRIAAYTFRDSTSEKPARPSQRRNRRGTGRTGGRRGIRCSSTAAASSPQAVPASPQEGSIFTPPRSRRAVTRSGVPRSAPVAAAAVWNVILT